MIDLNQFGFLPETSGEENSRIFNRAAGNGGTLVVKKEGIYDLTDTVFLTGNTRLIFLKGVKLRRTANQAGQQTGTYFFLNKGALTKTYDENITIEGLHIICNGFESYHDAEITGLRGQVSFFYVRNLTIKNFTCMDLLPISFAIQVCTFENFSIDGVHVEGLKDGVHLGRGKNFTIRNGVFKTYDDPIAINAHDFTTGNPQLGWIENGLIENCYDLDDESTTGFFCRILAGCWVDWYQGMKVQNSNTVVYQNRVYRVLMDPDGTQYISNTPPQHASGIKEYDGIKWVMVQEEVEYDCGCRNLVFRDIHLKKKRTVAIAIHFDRSRYSQGIYPGATLPVQENIVLEKVYVENQIDTLVRAITPVKGLEVRNSEIREAKIEIKPAKEIAQEFSAYLPKGIE